MKVPPAESSLPRDDIPPEGAGPSRLSLRQKAEAAFLQRENQSGKNPADLSAEGLQTLLHELRVHQIELEMQNEELRRAQIELDASRARYFDLYDLAPVGYITIGGAGLIREANLTAALLIGVERQALLRSPLSKFIFPADQDIYYKLGKQLIETGKPQQCEIRMVKPDGLTFWTQISSSAAQSSDGSPQLRVVISDISARKAEQDDLNTLWAAVNQSASAITITNYSGAIKFANPAFEKITGYTRAEALGHNPPIMKPGEQNKDFHRELWETIHANKTWRGEFHTMRKDGSLYWESATISPVQNNRGETLHYIVIQEDITGRKLLEERLADALRRAEAAAAAKSEFLSVMSHELRTPLNGVLGFAELLADTPLDAEQKSFTNTISRSGEHLLAIVNDILDFASIEHGSLAIHPAPFAVADLVESSAVTIRPAAAENGISFRCELGPGLPDEITGDERRIRQVLINLLGNALKFTERGAIVFRVAPAADGLFLEFSVEDTGIGISSETLALLFKPFTQANSTASRPFGGTGLGLAISKRLAEAMGASISATSTLGRGSTFTFRLPLDVPPGRETGAARLTQGAPKVPASVPPGGALILVVEDEHTSARLVGKMLQGLGYRAELVCNGAEALKAFVPGKFSAILMDMSMPVMNGLEATEKIRAVEAGGGFHVPIIALTANVMPEDRDRCLTAGMDDFLTKPFKQAELAAKLTKVVPR